jgi:hypothetical protein
MTEMADRAKRVAKQIIASILDKGLSESTWRESSPAAYLDLLRYRRDLEADVARTLLNTKEYKE